VRDSRVLGGDRRRAQLTGGASDADVVTSVSDHATRQESPRSPWSRPSVLLSGAFLLGLVLLGVVVAATNDGSNPHKRTLSPRATAAAGPGPQRPAGGAAACTLTAGSQVIPSTSPPAGTTWDQVGSMVVPQAAHVYGPERMRGVWNYCFAHDPSGALLAAMNFWAEGTAADATAVMRHLATGPVPRSALGQDRLDAAGPVQLVGYKFGSYQPDEAQIFVALRGPQGKLGSVLTTMRWTGADWRFAVPATGTPALQALTDLTGYVSWSSF
jgi:hypothetical protein